MKRKINYLSAALLGAVALFSSCSSSDDNTYVDQTDLTNSNEAAYALVASGYLGFTDMSSSLTELEESPTDYGSSYLGSESADAQQMVTLDFDNGNDYVVWAWDDYYWSIGNANTAIETIEASDSISQTVKADAIARAKFIRGLAYSKLVELFGEVPLRLTTAEANVTERSSIDAVYSQIVKDLTEAEAVLPENTSSTVVPSKGAADALLARVYLQWASNPLTQQQVEAIKSSKSDPALTWNTSRLQLAIQYADKVIKSGVYGLLSDFTKNWGIANENTGTEHIYTVQHDGDGIDATLGNHQYHCAWTYPFQETTNENHIHPLSTFTDWDNADPRKAWSIVDSIVDPRDNSIHLYRLPVNLPVYGKGIDRSTSTSVYETVTQNNVDRIEIRYAEVLLIEAEALTALGEGEQAAQYLNQLRERAYGNTLHDVTTATLKDVQDEWEHEFVYEQNHWRNLTRWKNLIATVQGVSNFEIFKDEYATAGNIVNGQAVTEIAVRNHDFAHRKYDNIDGHFYRFPIPLGLEGQDLGVTPQNPGY